MNETIKQVLMRRDKMSADEADQLIQDAQEQLNEYLEDGDLGSASEICLEFFGLEEDFMYELI